MTPAVRKALVNIAHIGKVKRRRIAHLLTSQRIQFVGRIAELPDQPMRWI